MKKEKITILETVILGYLYECSMHGYELKQHLNLLTGHFRPVSDGALYPAIARLERQGFVVKQKKPGKAAAAKQELSLTEDGRNELLSRIKNPSDQDISDRNRFFAILAFMRYLQQDEQKLVLAKRLQFLEDGKSFFQANGSPVKYMQEDDPFRKGMLLIAKETSKIEREWLKLTIDSL